jgi:uncharacterized protein
MGHYGCVTSLPPPSLRVSDAEREPVVEQLRQAFTEGRLTKDEFDQRLARALSARTHGELAPVLTGLPVPVQPHGPVAGLPRPGPPMPAPPDSDEIAVAVAAHLLGAVTSFVGPLILVIAAGNGRTGFSRDQAVEALNFQLSLLLITLVTLGIGGVVYAFAWIFSIIAAVNAGGGQPFRYPLTWRLVRLGRQPADEITM